MKDHGVAGPCPKIPESWKLLGRMNIPKIYADVHLIALTEIGLQLGHAVGAVGGINRPARHRSHEAHQVGIALHCR